MRITEDELYIFISYTCIQGQQKHFLSGEEIIINLIYFQQGKSTIAIEI